MAVQAVPFFSAALYARKSCFVYVPPSYEDGSDRKYPVIYLLHGMYGSESHWLNRGGAEATLERMIEAGELRECIVVMPNDGGYGQGTFYVDWYDGTGRFEQYMVDDLFSYIDANYRTTADRSFRAIAGLSMGGFGAYSLALRHPEVFGAAASLSGGLGSIGQLPYADFSRSDWARMVGPQRGEYAKGYDLALLSASLVQDAERPALYLNCGREDSLYQLNALFREHLSRIGYDHTYEEFDGVHDWAYWTEHLPDALRFIESVWRQHDAKKLSGEA